MGGEQLVHDKFITESVWCIKSKWEINNIVDCLKEALNNDPHVRGDPSRFSDHLTLFSCQNENKYGREDNFKACGQYLSQFPEGCVSVFGPATAATWWPKNGPDNAGNIKWDTISQQYFKTLTDHCPHPWMRGTAPLQKLTLR